MLIQKELAELAGTTIYTVSRVLSGWEHIGIVTKSRGRVIVSDRGKLEEIAAGGE
jgi:CRP-like cAMP-binding protein